ncbi:prominin-1 isoform X4 [Diabrotica virgifera virgifera]|uniref:Prominin-1-A n=1 Tax=Diabrotica virgifera virgifera TaxID=50390 RepID=A0ABM5KWF2_DIAVI|nr:prominin-1 isoform X4 [Diabrotica virgifera virgifera]
MTKFYSHILIISLYILVTIGSINGNNVMLNDESGLTSNIFIGNTNCNESSHCTPSNFSSFNSQQERNLSISTPLKLAESTVTKIKNPQEADDGKIKHKNITTSSTRNSGMPFLEIPKGDDMRIQELKLDEEYLIFGAFSTLMGFLQPTGFPSDLLRQILNNRMPPYLVALQILKMDIIVVVWIIIWAVLSLCLPIAVAAQLCCANGSQRLDEDYSIGPFASAEKCTKRFLEYSLHILLFLLILAIAVILAANEQISRSTSKSPLSTNIVYEDINTFFRNTHMQISFVVTSSTDIAIEDIREDMEAVVDLLGQPYQQELALEVGIDLALIELEELKLSSYKVTSLVSALLEDCAAAKIAGVILQEKLNEISLQLTIARQQCDLKDRTLCYTLQHSGFEVSFSMDNLTSDPKIRHLDTLAREDNFNGSIEAARKSFASVPDQVALETTSYITEARAILNRKRTEVYKSTHALDVLMRSLSETLRLSQESVLTVVHKIVDFDFWRWIIVLGISSSMFVVWGLLLCGAPCGCGITSRTVPFLFAGIGISCFVVIFIWALGSFSVFIGGHSQSFVCNTMYDAPDYNVLGELFDSDGVIFKEGLFSEFSSKENDTLHVADAIKQCQRDYPVYQTFHLNNTINIDNIVNYKQWEDLTVLFSNLSHGECSLEILSPSLQLNLQGLSSASSLNLTYYRLQSSGPVTKRDLNSFADQLNTVARQLSDAGSARKFDNLAFSVRKTFQSEVKRLIEIRNTIMYKITTLEVLLPPLNQKINDSLENLKNIQFFLDTKGSEVANKVRTQFISRLISYLEDLYSYAKRKISKEIGKCRPLWEIFHSSRVYACKLIVDPLNAIAFSSFLVIIIFLTMAPIVLNLVQHYRQFDGDLSSFSPSNGLLDEESAWASPASGTPPEIQLVETSPPAFRERPTISTWTSPSPPRLPTISSQVQSPRKLSALTSRISKARQITQMAITGSRSPRRGRRNHESLKLVEPICWKVGSTTPKSWI